MPHHDADDACIDVSRNLKSETSMRTHREELWGATKIMRSVT